MPAPWILHTAVNPSASGLHLLGAEYAIYLVLHRATELAGSVSGEQGIQQPPEVGGSVTLRRDGPWSVNILGTCRFDDLVGDNICPLDVELKWMTEISSSVYATPLITDLYADGRKDIIVPGFVHYTEVLEGPDGAKALGWPGFHRSTVHSSPLLYNIDYDGIRDILVATYDGEIVFFKDNVSQLGTALCIHEFMHIKAMYQTVIIQNDVDLGKFSCCLDSLSLLYHLGCS